MAKRVKQPKDANAPKRPQSGYLLFTNKRRPLLKAENPTAKITDLSKLIGAEWGQMTDEDKKPYQEEALELKKKYAIVLEEYKKTPEYSNHQRIVKEWKAASNDVDSTSPQKKKRAPKKPKDKNAPKGPQTSYFIFTRERRPALKEAHPTLRVTELAKLLGEEWKALDADTKKIYQEKALADKVRHRGEMDEYKKMDSYREHQAVVAKWEQKEKIRKMEERRSIASNKKKAARKAKESSESESSSESSSSESSSSDSSSDSSDSD